MEFKVSVEGPMNDPYREIIANMLELELPGTAHERCSAFEAVVSQLVGTKQARNGPTPDPENLVAIRATVRDAMAKGEPIPILVPFGASKQGDHGMDLAEVMALKQLDCLHQRVLQHYGMGLDITVRIEDASDKLLFSDIPGWAAKTDRYVSEFAKLVPIVVQKRGDWKNAPRILLESSKLDLTGWKTVASLLIELIRNPTNQLLIEKVERDLGWKGGLPQQQLVHYSRLYEKFYPMDDRTDRDWRLARYFTTAIMRKIQGATGAALGQNPVTLYFGHSVPGTDQTRRLYYRTVPERYQHTHRAPWLAKGYIQIKGRDARPALAEWNTRRDDYRQNYVVLSDNDSTWVEVEADYVVID